MTETGYFESHNNRLVYSCEIPSTDSKRVGIVFVHAAYGNRLGPHRMFVELARKFNSLGYPTFRFDLSGCGDSTGSVLSNDIMTDAADVAEAVNFFMAKAALETVILFGISRGSRICYATAGLCKAELGGMILLSIPVSSKRTAIKSLITCLKEYGYKLKDTNNLRKLLSGRGNLPWIWQTMVTAFQIKRRYAPAGNKSVPKCPILFVYGGSDPITDESSHYYANECNKNGLSYRFHVIRGANHSFFHYKWKEEIFDVSKQWLAEILT